MDLWGVPGRRMALAPGPRDGRDPPAMQRGDRMPGGLNVQDLSYAYGSRRALDGVSFAVPEGRFCALLGPNGAGKSTLFALLTRLFVAPARTHRDRGLRSGAGRPARALARMGVVFQQPTLDLDLTVRRNLTYFAALHGIAAARGGGAHRGGARAARHARARATSGRATSTAATGGAPRSPAR